MSKIKLLLSFVRLVLEKALQFSYWILGPEV